LGKEIGDREEGNKRLKCNARASKIGDQKKKNPKKKVKETTKEHPVKGGRKGLRGVGVGNLWLLLRVKRVAKGRPTHTEKIPGKGKKKKKSEKRKTGP